MLVDVKCWRLGWISSNGWRNSRSSIQWFM